ncbi:MAG: ROK family protein [Gammaproteobacteria bacterium]
MNASAAPSEDILTLAVDIGGSGTKAIVLDGRGEAVGERIRVPTPRPATPDAVIGALRELVAQQGEFQRVSVAFPGVVRQGVTISAPNLHADWEGFDLASTLREAFERPVKVANDADVQGYGAITGKGVELVITLGTGFGSALFVNGHLVPNLEMAHHPLRKGRTYEEELGRAALEATGRKRWNKRLQRAIETLRELFNFDQCHIGGGEAKKISFELPDDVRIVPNILGLLGGIALWRDD